jgi:hypothetical protein
MKESDSREVCSYCKEPFDEVPYRCKHCEKLYCGNHHLPENHECPNFKKGNIFIKLSKKEPPQPEETSTIPEEEPPKETESKLPEPKRKIPIVKIFFLILIIIGIWWSITSNFWSKILNWQLLNCTDGTLYDRCSSETPFYCFNGTLIKNSTFCGCPYDYRVKGNDCELIPRCSDGTIYDECSKNKPLFCLNGNLVWKSSLCGCPADEISQGETCISKYQINPKTINLSYIFNESRGSLEFEVYGGLNSYLANIERTISYKSGEPEPTFKDFVIKNIDNQKQQEYLLPLAGKIKLLSNNSDDQARIAISMVQNIAYDYQKLKDRYAYQVLYDYMGICGEKSRLLVSILRNLGYGTALIDYGSIKPSSPGLVNISWDISHEAVGIRCPQEYSYKNTGYCFVETTSPSIITYSNGDYPSMICIISPGSSNSGCTQKLPDNYTLTVISNGKSFDSVMNEYNDAQEWDRLNILSQSSGGFLDQDNYNRWWSLANKYGIVNS